MESNIRFMIRSYIRMAEFSDGEERKEYISIARDLLEKISFDCCRVSKLEDCKNWIIENLDDEEKSMYEFKIEAYTFGWSQATLQRAMKELEENNEIVRWSSGFGADKRWFIYAKT